MEKLRDYTIRSRFMSDGLWRQKDVTITQIVYSKATRLAVAEARDLDEEYGDSHFWTVTLTGPNGDYFQLFHQRMHDGYANMLVR